MSQVFVSYLSPDSGAVDPIKTVLREAGLSVWEEAEPTPDNFGEQLRRGLELTLCVILVWSKAAAESQWTLGGMRQAMRVWSSGRLVLAALDDSPLPIGLRDIRPFRVGGDSPSELNQLVEHAKSIVAASGAVSGEPSAVTPMGDFAPRAMRALNSPPTRASGGAGFQLWSER